MRTMGDLQDVLLRFGQRVRELRRLTGLSQEELAALCGLDRTYVSSLERGKRNVGLRNIAALASALGVSLSQFFEGVTSDEDILDS
jgi:transcriptional regulator with XRE-family HTH domain